MERSGYTYEEISARIDSQMKDDEYLKLADEVIRNDDSIEELEQTVVRLFLAKAAMAAVITKQEVCLIDREKAKKIFSFYNIGGSAHFGSPAG